MKNTITFRLIENGILWGLFICLIFPLTMPDLFGSDGGFIAAGPDGGLVHALAIDPANPQTVYAGTLNGVFKSTDGGNHWSTANTGIEGIGIPSLAIDPENTRTVYAGSFDSLFKSADGGKSWIKLNSGPGLVEGNLSVVLDPLSPQTLYLGSMPYGIVKSTDGGVHWMPANSGIMNKNVNGLIINPSSPAILYAGTHKGLFRTIDGGTSWKVFKPDFNLAAGRILAIDARATLTVYTMEIIKKNDLFDRAGISRFKFGPNGWWKSDMASLPSAIHTLALDPESLQKVYATTSIGIYTNYGGNEWTAIGDEDYGRGVGTWIGFIAMALDPASPGTFWFANRGGLSRCAFVPRETLPGIDIDASNYFIRKFGSTPLSNDIWKVEKTWPVFVDVGGIAVAPTSPPTVYAATSCCGVLKNTVGTGD